MKNNMLRALLLIITLMLCSCSSIVQTPQVAYKTTIFKGMDKDGADMECLLTISNPNAFDIPLSSYNYQVRISDLPLASGNLQRAINIAAKNDTIFPIPVRINYRDLLELAKHHHNLENIPINVQGKLRLDTPIGVIGIPVSVTENFSVPEKYRPGHNLNGLFKTISNIR